jgi:hypothetical protein
MTQTDVYDALPADKLAERIERCHDLFAELRLIGIEAAHPEQPDYKTKRAAMKALRLAEQLRHQLDAEVMHAAVEVARSVTKVGHWNTEPKPWSEIGTATNTSKQAAVQKWSHRRGIA